MYFLSYFAIGFSMKQTIQIWIPPPFQEYGFTIELPVIFGLSHSLNSGELTQVMIPLLPGPQPADTQHQSVPRENSSEVPGQGPHAPILQPNG